MDPLCVSLFGKFHVQCGDRHLTNFCSPKVQELFCYLLLFRDRPHPREVLASLLWSDTSTAQSRKCLRQALWHLQAALNSQVESNEPVLIAEPDWVQLMTAPCLWLDVSAFEQAFASVQGVADRYLDEEQAQALQRAVQVYKGDLLEGWYHDWCLYERERLQNMYLSMLDKLIGYCGVNHKYEDGVVYGTRILQYDRARERTHRRLMRLYYLAGDRTAALRQYERCVTALKEELDVAPSERTLALCQQIRADRLDDQMWTGTGANAIPESMPVLPETLDRLKYVWAALEEAQNQIQGILQEAGIATSHPSF